MSSIKRVEGRGVNGFVVIVGEAVFAPGTDLPNWKRRLSARISDRAAGFAPTNKRPRWAHYGKPLKQTFTTSSDVEITGKGGFILSAVGALAPYAAYVDQGTGIHGRGRGPYQAKILPPWYRGSPSLYEHTWRPGPGQPPIGTTTVLGQRAQGFMDKGLRAGLASMGMRSHQLPDEGVRSVATLKSDVWEPPFLGNTPWSFAFDAQLREWRSWRDQQWGRDRPLGEGAAKTRGEARIRERWSSRSKTSSSTSTKSTSVRTQPSLDEQYRASRDAADRRKRDLARDIAAKNLRKSEGAKRKREQEANLALARGNDISQDRSREFYNKIRQAYPDARRGSTTLPDGVVVWQVWYTDSSGETHRQRWAYGYTD